MADELNNGALRLAVAQICQSMGWDALQKSTHDLLTDVLQRYMQEIGKSAYGYSQLYCHTEPSLDDLGLAFKDTGVLVHELEDFVTQVDQVPFSYQLPRFPMPKSNLLHHPQKDELVDRPEFYHEHLPPLIKALQQNEDERERDTVEIQGLENSSDPTKSFLRSEIKTVGQETQNELIENGPDKRSVNSSMDYETEAKRRRLESPFGKQNKENKLDILQVLQEKNSQSQSPSPSPDFIPMETDDKKSEKSVFTFTSAPTPSVPKTNTNTKKKGVKKTENPPKDKKLLATPEKKRSKAATGVTDSPKKTSPGKTKSKEKQKPASSPAKKKNASPAKSPIKSSPKTKPKPQDTFPKSTTTQVTKPKELSPQKKKEPISIKTEKALLSPPRAFPMPPDKSDSDEARIKTQPMPKLIIKPLKHEKSQPSEYSVAQIPLEPTFGLEKKKAPKRKLKTEPGTLEATMDETKPKKKKKKKEPVIATIVSSSNELPLPGNIQTSVSSTQMFSEGKDTDKVIDTVKKKKKKHKEKDREKNKPKKVKETSNESLFSSSSSSSKSIPTIKLKLENPPSTNTTSSELTSGSKLVISTGSEVSSKKPPSKPIYSLPAMEPQITPHAIKQETFEETQPVSSAASTGSLLMKNKEELPRTVITETLSTTVQLYYCPACGLADDGSFMIGCDSCDSWYHGMCVGISDDPGGDWYCEDCAAKKAKKKKKKKSKDKDKYN